MKRRRTNNIYSAEGAAYGGICADETGLNGNISADPLFVDPLNGNYRLQVNSPAIDAGDNAAPNLPVADLDGNPRIFDGDFDGMVVVDMGALEFAAGQQVLTVQVADGGTPGLTDTAIVTIDVGDVNEAPVIADQTIIIVGIPEIGTVVGTRAASDPDQGDTLTFVKQGGTGSDAFMVDPTSGVVSVLDNTLLDFETSPSLTLEVLVLDSAGLSSATAIVTISPPPAITPRRIVENQAFAINESPAAASIVGYVSTSGPDADDAMTFAITGGTGAGLFAIDPASGAIIFIGNTPIEFAATPSLTLDVQVTNSLGLVETATITIGEASAIGLSSLDGTDGFVLFGSEFGTNSGFSVSSAGDVNGDGFDDIIIGTTYNPSGSSGRPQEPDRLQRSRVGPEPRHRRASHLWHPACVRHPRGGRLLG